tara:strand:+ start:277 stop:438 length:162 start_codon:yes stop_codon:yes gene_type:complete
MKLTPNVASASNLERRLNPAHQRVIAIHHLGRPSLFRELFDLGEVEVFCNLLL